MLGEPLELGSNRRVQPPPVWGPAGKDLLVLSARRRNSIPGTSPKPAPGQEATGRCWPGGSHPRPAALQPPQLARSGWGTRALLGLRAGAPAVCSPQVSAQKAWAEGQSREHPPGPEEAEGLLTPTLSSVWGFGYAGGSGWWAYVTLTATFTTCVLQSRTRGRGRGVGELKAARQSQGLEFEPRDLDF